MSVETEVKEVVASVEAEVAKVEATAAAPAEEAKTVAEKIEAAVEKTEAVAAEVKAAVVQISTEEKLFLREAELEFLKATMDIQRLQTITATKTKEYQAFVDSMLKKYNLTKEEYVFDGTINIFKKK